MRVKKIEGSWRMCIDFKNLNSACPKDYYPLSDINGKIESWLRTKKRKRSSIWTRHVLLHEDVVWNSEHRGYLSKIGGRDFSIPDRKEPKGISR
uniref:Reverse transcriptase domain-containing protein n=1 Tax=Tanacetum cinerariifolium TaxID=118510 RepID=A0A699R2N4_TANCI|nr:reverse transcriptase domain-containing protein [Tanacetum cinerariifolium]